MACVIDVLDDGLSAQISSRIRLTGIDKDN